MQLIEYLTIFGMGFVSVFALAFQSLAVNRGLYKLAAGNAFLIGLSNAFLWNKIVSNDTFTGALVYGLSGAFAVVAAMALHERMANAKVNNEERS